MSNDEFLMEVINSYKQSVLFSRKVHLLYRPQ